MDNRDSLSLGESVTGFTLQFTDLRRIWPEDPAKQSKDLGSAIVGRDGAAEPASRCADSASRFAVNGGSYARLIGTIPSARRHRALLG